MGPSPPPPTSTSHPPDVIHVTGVPRAFPFFTTLQLHVLNANRRTKMGEGLGMRLLPPLSHTHAHISLCFFYIHTLFIISPPPFFPYTCTHCHASLSHTLTLACAMALMRVALAAAASLSSVAWFMISCTSLSIASVSTEASCANCSCSAFSSRMMALRNCWETSEGMRTWRSW